MLLLFPSEGARFVCILCLFSFSETAFLGNEVIQSDKSPIRLQSLPIKPTEDIYQNEQNIIGEKEPTSASENENEPISKLEKKKLPKGNDTKNEELLPAVEEITSSVNISQTKEEEAKIFMQQINEDSARKNNNASIFAWNYFNNITETNKKLYVESKIVSGEFVKERWNRIQEWKAKWPTFASDNLKRQFELFSVIGNAALPKEKYKKLTTILTEMEENYGIGKICDYKNSSKCDLSLEPEIEYILQSSQDYDELAHIWKAWRDVAGKPVRNLYTEFVKLSNEAALLNGFPSTAEMWIHDYESETFEDDVAHLYNQLSPLYKQLHAYTRRKLREVYGESRISKRGPIPAHVTGNMWAQTWRHLYDILVPFPNKTSVDVTDAMKQQGYTPRLMFEKADDFFASLNLERVPPLFWNKSVIEKPEDRKLVCHASAWDFLDGKDFRVKQCTDVDMKDFDTAHHELGHIQYYIQYKDLPYIFREGANPGFHEAIGDIMGLSVSTPKHLHKIDLLHTYETDNEADINFLLKTALYKVAFLPFGYMIDKYRWGVFRGHITPDNYTKAWWQYRHDFQGITPPVPRSELDFDPAAKYHVSSNTKYIRYFVSFILQFQFHKALCLLAKEYDPNDPLKPMHRCDIYQSAEAGKALKDMMILGKSQHWRQPLKAITGSEVMDASALMEYFRPLEKWLIADNEKHQEFIGWEGGHTQAVQNDHLEPSDEST